MTAFGKLEQTCHALGEQNKVIVAELEAAKQRIARLVVLGLAYRDLWQECHERQEPPKPGRHIELGYARGRLFAVLGEVPQHDQR